MVDEDGQKRPKRPDYGFRTGSTTHFFVETKRPNVNLKEDSASAFQLRRYGWSGNLPVSVLTNFEEFCVYDCRIQPKRLDPANKARLRYWRYDEYHKIWDEMASRFSREAVASGSLWDWVEGEKIKGLITVDQAFLQEMENWREMLAKDIALHNKLDQRSLNLLVQRTIDRIVFLRIAEDRGIEIYGRLRSAIGKDRQVYELLKSFFQEADDKYNSGLFHFGQGERASEPDHLALKIDISNEPLRNIISKLYYPSSPYEFSVLPADILGQVYERFLGKVIELSDTGIARVELKPEVRKAGGVYYTPTYIVDYIVKNTVGKLLEGKAPSEAAKLRILDPACGSGSFLAGAYQYLLDWHFDYYRKHPRRFRNRRRETPNGMVLTIPEKRRILLNNIYGVDLDQNAVEVSKLSLLLKMLENENGTDATGLQTAMFAAGGRILPDLSNNIKWGNSLIGTDFFIGEQKMRMMFDDEEKVLKVKPFDWENPKHGFGEIMKAGGFDVVIGNPPYIDSEWMTRYHPLEREYCTEKYKAASGNEVVAFDNQILSIRDYSHIQVFPVGVYPIVYVAQKIKPIEKYVTYEKLRMYRGKINLTDSHSLDYKEYFGNPKYPWRIFSNIDGQNIIKKMQNNKHTLAEVAQVHGAATVAEAYEIKLLLAEAQETSNYQIKVVNSGTIDRFSLLWGQKTFRYIKLKFRKPVIPFDNQPRLPQKRLAQAKSPKIIIAGMTKRLECALDTEGKFLAGKSTTIVLGEVQELKYLTAILNSKLINFFYKAIYGGNKLSGDYLRIGPPQLRTIPIRKIDFSKRTDVAMHDKIVSLVDTMLSLHKKLRDVPGIGREIIESQIERTDAEIDALVYELYGLTADEVEIVEG